MEIKLGDRVYQIPDACPVDAPRPSTLKRNLREHGAEAFLLSHKLAPLAGCIVDELVEAGAEIVPAEAEPSALADQGETETPTAPNQPGGENSPSVLAKSQPRVI